MEKFPLIDCEITFLSPEKGGRRKPFPEGILSSRKYLPHLVVGDPLQRIPILGKYRQITEEYLGVAFIEGPDRVEFDKKITARLALIYFPKNDYKNLVPGASFTIREGALIVGYGRVMERKNI